MKIRVFFCLVTFFLLLVSCPSTTPPGSELPLPVVTNVIASRLEYSDKIRVTWDNLAEADSYVVYRYKSNQDESPVDCTFSSVVNYFDDSSGLSNGAIQDKPYYYRVSCKKNGNESELSANLIEGIYSSVIDIFEPNDDKSLVKGIGTTECPALIYSFNKGEAQDVDWYTYKYSGIGLYVAVVVTLPDDTIFDSQLNLRFDNDQIEHNLVKGANTFNLLITNDLYFQIYFKTVDPDINRIGSYKVKME